MPDARDIEVLEGLESVRRTPAMYIGEATIARLVEVVLDSLRERTRKPTAVRLILWRGGITIAFDGEPFGIAHVSRPVGTVPHPELYWNFLYLGPSALDFNRAAVLNALSSRLVVSTMSGGDRYRVSFRSGALVSLLDRSRCAAPLGASWMTFEPDPTVLSGDLTPEVAAEIVARTGATFEDRSDLAPDWS